VNEQGNSSPDDASRTDVSTTPEIPGASPASPEQPSHIGRYRVERLLAKGSFGCVYLAHDEQLKRLVAVKVPHADLVATPEDARPYLTEASTVASLDHPHIVPVYDVGTTEQCPCYVVSKYIDGTDLANWLKQKPMPLHDAVELVATVAEALHHAHLQGFVHRDIKPGNILIDASGKPYVTDFGLALKESDFGKEPRYAGSPAYMSPEQAKGQGHLVDGRSDIFSLGVVFYELLTGRRPFRAESRQELLEQVIDLEARPPRQIDDTIPKELERVCLKALQKRLSDRYTTAKDLADDLRRSRMHIAPGVQTSQPEDQQRLPNPTNAMPDAAHRVPQNRKVLHLAWVALVAIVLGLVAGAIVVAKRAASGSHERDTAQAPVEALVEPFHIAPIRPEQSNMVELFHFKWLPYEKGRIENEGVKVATIINPAVDDVCALSSACGFAFELQPRPGIPWVRVDGIDIIVEDYKPLPEGYATYMRAGGRESTHVYYVELDSRSLPKTHTFSAARTRITAVPPRQAVTPSAGLWRGSPRTRIGSKPRSCRVSNGRPRHVWERQWQEGQCVPFSKHYQDYVQLNAFRSYVHRNLTNYLTAAPAASGPADASAPVATATPEAA
jgi:predicted Ser/Thr protein kinase